MTYCFDIDGTLCTNTLGDYEAAQPFQSRIEHINRLYEVGHTIKLFTARGSTTGIDWREVTESQLTEWGLRYHTLIMGKPFADFFIDDKATNSEEYSW